MRDLYVGILEHKQVASKKGKNVERAGFSVGIVEHCVRECRGMESIGLLYLTLSSLPIKWHHRQLQGPFYDIGSGTFLKEILPQKNFYRPNLLSWSVVKLVSFGRAKKHLKLKTLVSKFAPWDLEATRT